MSKICIVDFDDTVCNPSDNPWPSIGPPKKGVQEALQKIKNMGYEVHILSCRTSPEVFKHSIDRQEQVKEMEAYLKEHNISYDKVLNKDKPVAHVYIDDRGIGFRDNWEDVIEEVERMERMNE